MTAPSPDRLTQPERTARTRRKLVDAAERLFAEQSFDDTTVSEICDAAGVAKGTFYLHFPRKEDLLVEMGFLDSDELSDRVDELLARDTPVAQVLGAAIDLIAAQARKRPKHLMARSIQELFASLGSFAERKGDHHTYAEVFTKVFAKAGQRGEIETNFVPMELASTLSMGVLQSLLWWASGRSRIGLDTLLRRRVALVLAAARATDLQELTP